MAVVVVIPVAVPVSVTMVVSVVVVMTTFFVMAVFMTVVVMVVAVVVMVFLHSTTDYPAYHICVCVPFFLQGSDCYLYCNIVLTYLLIVFNFHL